MLPTYTQKQSPAQKKDAPLASSVLDYSSQSESLQRKADLTNNAAQRAEAPRPNNTGMPDNLKSGIESLSGFSMDDVRVHYNSSKPATVQALAYTQGTDIHVAPGQEKHLPHEAWHVAQQMAGRVSPTTNINGMPVNDNAALEHEADVMGEKAVTQRRIDHPEILKKEGKRKWKDYDDCRKMFYEAMGLEDKGHNPHKTNFDPSKKSWSLETIAKNLTTSGLTTEQADERRELATATVAQLANDFEAGGGKSWHIHKDGKTEGRYHIKFHSEENNKCVFNIDEDSRLDVENRLCAIYGLNAGQLRSKGPNCWDDCMKWLRKKCG